jgi:tetrahydromethanopterin S-methyltransferase subunit G
VTALCNEMKLAIMVSMDHDKEIREIKRRLDLAEAKASQQAGQFEFISGQLRDIQLYIHARFGDIDERLDRIESKVDALPRVIAELINSQRS